MAGPPDRIDPAALVADVVADLRAGTDVDVVAGAFHRWLADTIAQVATTLAQTHEVSTVALSGGVFQNWLLVELHFPSSPPRA